MRSTTIRFSILCTLFAAILAWAGTPQEHYASEQPRLDLLHLPLCSNFLNPKILESITALKISGVGIFDSHHPDVQEKLDFWIDRKKYPPITLESVKARDVRDDETHPCGDCFYMFRSNYHAFIEPLANYYSGRGKNQFWEAGKFILVQMNGQVIGVIKAIGGDNMEGDKNGAVSKLSTPSFLALRNVRNGKGELVLAQGGVYWGTQELIRKVLAVVNESGPFVQYHMADAEKPYDVWRGFMENFFVGLLNLDQIELRPATFLLNRDALENVDLIPRIAHPHGKFEYHYDSRHGLNISDEFYGKVWSTLLEQLDFIRVNLERDLQRDPTLSGLRAALRPSR